MGIAEARKAARGMHASVKFQGKDPIADGKTTETSNLGDLLLLYATRVGQRQKTWQEAQRRIETVFASQLKRPLAAVTPTDLQICADQHPALMSASAAVRYLRPVLK
jgi:hypothetical protein